VIMVTTQQVIGKHGINNVNKNLSNFTSLHFISLHFTPHIGKKKRKTERNMKKMGLKNFYFTIKMLNKTCLLIFNQEVQKAKRDSQVCKQPSYTEHGVQLSTAIVFLESPSF
jgi:hypothetical protein